MTVNTFAELDGVEVGAGTGVAFGVGSGVGLGDTVGAAKGVGARVGSAAATGVTIGPMDATVVSVGDGVASGPVAGVTVLVGTGSWPGSTVAVGRAGRELLSTTNDAWTMSVADLVFTRAAMVCVPSAIVMVFHAPARLSPAVDPKSNGADDSVR